MERTKDDSGSYVVLTIAVGLIGAVLVGASSSNSGGAMVGLVMLCIGALGIYFAPAIAASARQHPNAASIFVLNFFLGWTLLGWVVALAWAYKNPESAESDEWTSQPMKTCPFCAESILAAAVKCKHCGSKLAAA